MFEAFKSGKFKALLPYFLFAIGVIAAYRIITEINFFFNVIRQLWGIITPFFYGFLLAYILSIPFGGLQRLFDKIKFIKKGKKILSLVLTYLFFALILFLIFSLVIPYVYRIVSFFFDNLQDYFDRTMQLIHHVNSLNIPGIDIDISPDGFSAILQSIFQRVNIQNILTSFNVLLGIPNMIFIAFLAFISSIYILIEKEKFTSFLCRLLKSFVSPEISNVIIDYTGRLNKNFKRYIFIQTIDGLILGSIVTIQLFLMRSPFFLILGIMLGILNYIPYFGSIIGSLIAIFIVTFTQGIAVGAIAAVVLLVTQQIDGNIIQPKLMGGSFSLSPFLIILSVTVGGAFAGVFGMIAAIPLVAIMKDILENIITYREQQQLKNKDS